MAETIDTSPETFNKMLEQMLPVAHGMGVEAVELRPGYAEARVPIEGNGNHIGTMYAGVLFTVAEVLGGALVLSSFDVTKFYPVVTEVTIGFRAPARGAVTAKASMSEAEIAELSAAAAADGKAKFTLAAELFDEEGKLVAETESRYQIRAHGT